jgi:hypothetical protein
MNRLPFAAALLLACASPCTAATGPFACRAPESGTVRLRFAEGLQPGDAIEGRIGGSTHFALELRDAQSGALLWTAGAAPGALLQVAGMDAPFLARPVPVDLDGDGLHDRIYAADLAGRIWRVELEPGAAREDWARAVLFADLSGGGLRGFLAAPDVALHTSASGPWLSIAIGSVSLGSPGVNRFYLLRDLDMTHDAGGAGPPALPLREGDLLPAPASAPGRGIAPNDHWRGFYLPIGDAQVLAPSMTIDGTIVFTAARLPPMLPCTSFAGVLATIEVRALQASDASVALDFDNDGHRDDRDAVMALPGLRPADSAARIADPDDPAVAAEGPRQRPCVVGADPIPGCSVDLRVRRRYWLREDAD